MGRAPNECHLLPLARTWMVSRTDPTLLELVSLSGSSSPPFDPRLCLLGSTPDFSLWTTPGPAGSLFPFGFFGLEPRLCLYRLPRTDRERISGLLDSRVLHDSFGSPPDPMIRDTKDRASFPPSIFELLPPMLPRFVARSFPLRPFFSSVLSGSTCQTSAYFPNPKKSSFSEAVFSIPPDRPC